MLSWLWGRATALAGAVGFVLTVAGIAFLRGRKAGTAAIVQRQAEKAAKKQEQYDEIDSERPDLDAAIGRLRDRAER